MDRFGLVGTVLEGRYRIDRIVAEGGFGVVYQGTHNELDTPLAIKVLKPAAHLGEEAAREFVEKFRLEAKTLAKFRHPNIVLVQDTGVSTMPAGGQAAWMVLEWLEGETLKDYFKRNREPMSPTQALELLRPVLDALAYAHDESVAHRDVKPENIFLMKSKRGHVVKLLDFGIAKLVTPEDSAGSGETQTQSLLAAFSPHYAAPEQITNSRTGPWTDVHAIALVLVRALVGRAPYPPGDKNALFQEVLSPTRPTPAKHGLDVGSWEGVLRKALAFRPDERHRNAGEFLAELDGHVQEVTVSWGRGGAPQRTLGADTTGVTGAVQPITSPSVVGTLAAVTSGRDLETPPKSSARNLAIGAAVLVGVLGIGGLGIWLGRTSHPTASAPAAAAQAVSAAPQPASPIVAPPPQPAAVARAAPPAPAPPPRVERPAVVPPIVAAVDAGAPKPTGESPAIVRAPTTVHADTTPRRTPRATTRPARNNTTRGSNGASNL